MGTDATRVVLDTGALIAIDRGVRWFGLILDEAVHADADLLTSTTCSAQAWRRPERQVRLQRLLGGITEHEFDRASAREAGRLMGQAGSSDIADAAVALLVEDGDAVYTSDPVDIRHLLDVRGVAARVEAI